MLLVFAGMGDTPQPKKPRKPATEMTDEELIRKVFPKRVVEAIKKALGLDDDSD